MLVQNDDFGAAYEESFEAGHRGHRHRGRRRSRSTPPGANEVGVADHQPGRQRRRRLLQRRHPAGLPRRPDQGQGRPAGSRSPGSRAPASRRRLMGIAGERRPTACSASTNLKDPLNPECADDEAMKLYREKVAQYRPTPSSTTASSPTAGPRAPCWSRRWRRSTETSPGSSFMEAVRNMDGVGGGPAAPGRHGHHRRPDDPFMGETVQLMQYDSANEVLRRRSASSSTSRARPPSSPRRT